MLQQILQRAWTLHQAGRLDEAEQLYGQVLAANPRTYAALHLMGMLRLQQGQPADAADFFKRALSAQPDALETLVHYGIALAGAGRDEKALSVLRQAATAAPRNAAVHGNLGALHQKMGSHAAALDAFERVLQLQPDHIGGLLNHASALSALGRFDAALADYDRILARDPGQPDALISRSNLLWSQHKALEPVLADTARLAQIAPDMPGVPGDLLHLKMYAGDWRDFDRDKAALDAGIRTGRPVVQPFPYQGLSDSPADLLACARMFADFKFPPCVPALAPAKAARRPGRIRVGYLSGEFRAQATAYLTAGLYEAHDRSRFEIIAFDNTPRERSPTRARLEAAFDRIIDITQLPDAQAAARIAAEDIDILVNFNGYFGALRMGVFAHKPAPIQVNYLGFPGTLGAPYMDYILADGIVIPAGEEGFFTEQVMRLPHSYQINDNKRAVPPPPPARHALGLPDEAFVFCHFNYSYKITPGIFALWMRLLAAIPGSVLWLLETYPLFSRNVRSAAQAAGIDPARLVFAPPLPMEDHVARLAAGDLFLDSLPYGAHTTGSDALWAGLPVLTCRGTAFAGRVGASLLTALGMPELITENLTDYEARALALARDSAMLAGLRARLAQARTTAPLFDTAQTTRAIEAAYQTMFERWLAS